MLTIFILANRIGFPVALKYANGATTSVSKTITPVSYTHLTLPTTPYV